MKSVLIRFGGHTIELTYSGNVATHMVGFLFGSSAAIRDQPGPDAADPNRLCRYRLDSAPQGHLTLRNHAEVIYSAGNEGQMAEFVQGEICRQLAAACTSGLVFHAAALQLNNRGLILPGTMGRGKSTLTAWLLREGWEYLTDEMVLFPQGATVVRGFTRPLNIKGTACSLFRDPLAVDRDTGTTLEHPGGILVQPVALGCKSSVAQTEPGAIVFPEYESGTSFEMRPMSAAEAGWALMECLVNARNLAQHGFAEITRLARTVRAYRIRYHALPEASQAITAALMHRSAGPGA